MNIEWTGERFIPGMPGAIELEHLHRYTLARRHVRDLRVLDVASGEGYGTHMLASAAAHAIGVDICLEAVQHAAATYVLPNLEYRLGSCAALPVETASIDVVVSFETIEHHDQHEEMMREITRVLKTDGFLLISSPNKREYSDAPGSQNAFHVRELYLDEFEQLLKRHFRSTALYAQRVMTASMIAPMARGPVLLRDYYDPAAPDRYDDGLHRPIYFLGVAGNAALPDPGGSFFESGDEYAHKALAHPACGETKVKLFWRSRLQPAYDENRVIEARMHLSGAETELSLIFPPQADAIIRLRLDMSECPAAIELHSLELINPAGNPAWAWDGNHAGFVNVADVLFRCAVPGSACTLFTTSSDPQFELDMPAGVVRQIKPGWQVRLRFTAHALESRLPQLIEMLREAGGRIPAANRLATIQTEKLDAMKKKKKKVEEGTVSRPGS